MKQYKQLLSDILQYGTQKPSARANMPGSLSLFGHQSRYDLAEGFPAVTTKKLYFKAVVVELLWFLKVDSNIKFMVDKGCNIWNEDAYGYYLKLCKEQKLGRQLNLQEFEQVIKTAKSLAQLAYDSGVNAQAECPLTPQDYTLGDTGNQYPLLWRQWEGKTEVHTSQHGDLEAIETTLIDQITNVIKSLRNMPESRRHIVTAWNPATVDDMALPACHCFFQFNCRPISTDDRLDFGLPKYHLDCQMYQRSGDTFLGVPFNIASYALLTHIFAKMCNMVPGHFIHTIGDAHIYDNHMEAVQEQLSRTPSSLPALQINTSADWSKMSIDEVLADINLETTFKLIGYNPQEAIYGELKTGL